MKIDRFILYDSFWEAHGTGDSENQTTLPPYWLTLLKITEFQIYDTALSSNFACHPILSCKNTMTNRFIVVNSSTSEKFDSLCNTGKGNVYPWIACMNNLMYFQYSHGKLTSLKNWFPREMKNLLVVNLTHNYIKTIDSTGFFDKLINLTTLDLSHNLIEYFDFFFKEMKLKLLDLSWNHIKTIDEKQFAQLTRLKSLNLANNYIVDLNEKSWKSSPESLKYIGLTGNPIICSCNVRWINATTIFANATIKGTCSSKRHKELPIRSANQLLLILEYSEALIKSSNVPVHPCSYFLDFCFGRIFMSFENGYLPMYLCEYSYT
ncbi:uncharacterized protein TNCT_689201 [Trichonephila clavata]|uniref:Uncharacterized protein n=1 Tax=Trichonephila clavata TaxID=2740835 RepID=A0A8X6L244_TRICU|nr:uncharacterized protein TNCT_689201 [Trichonephila clavata]